MFAPPTYRTMPYHTYQVTVWIECQRLTLQFPAKNSQRAAERVLKELGPGASVGTVKPFRGPTSAHWMNMARRRAAAVARAS